MRSDDRRAVLQQMQVTLAAIVSAERRFDAAVRDAARDGFSSRGDGSGPISGGSHGDPTCAIATTPNLARDDRQRLDALLMNARQQLARAERLVTRYTTMVERPERQSSLTSCGNPHGCDRTVTMIGNDRLIAGRCRRCWDHRRRHGLEWSPRVEGTSDPFATSRSA